MRRNWFKVVGIAVLLTLAVSVASAQVRTRTVAVSGTAAPSGGMFDLSVDQNANRGLLPAIAGNTIVFGTNIDLNGQSVYGVFVEANSVLRLATRVGFPSPVGGSVREIYHYTVDEAGNVFIAVRIGEGTGPDTILKYTNGALFALARVGDTLPTGETIESMGTSVASNAFGGVYFQVGITGPSGDGSALVLAKSDLTLTVVAATGMAAPAGGTFATISPTVITSSTSGLAAFAATVIGGTSGVFTGIAGNLVLAADASDALPNLALADNDELDLIFMRQNSPMIQQVSFDGTSTIASNSTSVPRTTGRMNFGNALVGLTADVEASVYFFAPVTGDEKVTGGLFKRDRFTREITAIALQGDPAAGDVSGEFGAFGLNATHPVRIASEAGKVVFVATAGFQGSETAIFTTLKAPEGFVPTVTRVQVKGNKLKVTGSRFEPGARILLSGNPLTDTKNNKKKPTELLISKSGGGQISVGETVSIIVVNPSGAQSAPVSFTRTN